MTCGETTQATSRAGDWSWTSPTPTASRTREGKRKRSAEADASVEQLAESGEDGGQSRRDEAAEVRRPGVRPDPGGLHEGVGSWFGFGRLGRLGRVYPVRRMRAPPDVEDAG